MERLGSVFGARKRRLPPISSSADFGGMGLFSSMDYASRAHIKPKKNHYPMSEGPPAPPVSTSMDSSRHNSLGEGEGSIDGVNDAGVGYDPAAGYSGEGKAVVGGEASDSQVKSNQSGMCALLGDSGLCLVKASWLAQPTYIGEEQL